MEAKVIFCRFLKWVHCSCYKRLNVLSYSTLHTCSVVVKSLTRFPHPFSHFYIVFLYYWTCSRPEYNWKTARWTISSNQSMLISRVITYFIEITPNLHVTFYEGNNMLSALAKYVINRLIHGLIHIALGADINVSSW